MPASLAAQVGLPDGSTLQEDMYREEAGCGVRVQIGKLLLDPGCQRLCEREEEGVREAEGVDVGAVALPSCAPELFRGFAEVDRRNVDVQGLCC